MKNTKIMVVLAIFLAAALFVSAGTAAGAADNNTTIMPPTGITFTNGTASIIEVKIGVNESSPLSFANVSVFSGEEIIGVNTTTINPGLNTYFITVTPKKAGSQVLTAKFVKTDGNPVDEANATYTSAAVNVAEKAAAAGTSKGTYFVNQMINVSGTFYKMSGDATPSVIDSFTIAAGERILPSVIGTNEGVWYTSPSTSGDYIAIWYPAITLKAELAVDNNGNTAGDSIDGKTINKNTPVAFLIVAPKLGGVAVDYTSGLSAASGDAYNKNATVKIVFTTPVAGKTTTFGYNASASTDAGQFTGIQLNTTQTLAENMAVRAGTDTAAGTWTAQAEFTAPTSFSDYAEKSNTVSFTLQSTTLTITAAKDSVIRSNPFTVTIQGDSKTNYSVYIDSPATNEVNPTLQEGQSGFQSKFEPAGLVFDTNYKIQNGYINYSDYAEPIGGVFQTDASGKRTIQFNTADNTEDKTYTIKVSGFNATEKEWDSSNYDKVKVKVEKGAVTIAASGDGSYYIGDEIKLTGTNTDSDTIFLFVTGQNLKQNGVILKALPTMNEAYTATSGDTVAVKTDDTWEYKWDTTRIGVDTGAYTIYATSRLTNGKSSDPIVTTSPLGTAWDKSFGVGKAGDHIAVKLSDSEYATISVNLKQPFLSAVPSSTVIAQGDKLYITGTAEGNPSTLKMYIFGPNYFTEESITVNDDGSYEKKFDVPSDLSSNQYFVVVQHPMYNGLFDVKLKDSTDGKYTYFYIDNTTTGNLAGTQGSFIVKGDNKLQGSQAADALTKMIDDANIDDIYTKLTFTVAAPYIRITNPGDQAMGSKFTISGTTNLAVNDQILVEVMSSSFTAIDKTSTSTTSGVSQATKVVAGDGVENAWSIEVDTTNWKLDEYTVKVNGIEVDVSTTTNFNLVEKVTTPTPTATGATPTTTATATATATETPKTPGFGAFIALAGLGAVALLVLRRN